MSRLINISDEVYKELTSLKGELSYTFIIKNLLKKRSNKEAILSFAGKGGIDEEKIKALKEEWGKWTTKSV